MVQPRSTSRLALVIALMFFCSTTLAHAAERSYAPRNTDDPSVEAMLADGLLLRPGGLVATVLGSVAFVVTLPFTLSTKSVDKAAQKFVVDPARYTFTRPFGQIDTPRPPQQ